MTPEKINRIYELLAAERPDPKSELNFSSTFELLVAVMLSAHTTDRSVNAATSMLFPVANTPQAVAGLGQEKIENLIRKVGLYRSKARHLVETSRILLEKHGGRVPSNFADLTGLPGVGGKTARVILNIGFGVPVVAVDTHIFRVSNRTGIAPGRTAEAVAAKLTEVTPEKYLLNAHHWLLLHGRYCCRATRPQCGNCPIRELCEFTGKTA